ncbi:PA0069 family radical SAM protein [Dechloromonas sp. XY25]|uniref:PA0069 family radical SAM protein n=1 Tax=Dechloromonas hankyongensis TaxID=2908002 RepID=A0ABS9K0L2_9RHOO|nr:PA0069 family radical SAM protein [Dechloromonas hankyongensis]MCG2576683.1 PA0069 family radical SAM protein [Dechloromonas hankyongensis]
MDDFDPAPSPEINARPVKGRGAVGNVDHRFTNETRRAVDDGWQQAEPSLPQTRLHVDSAKSIISRNDSPDLGFDQSLNPYRGCEHGCIYCYARPTHAWLGLSPGLDFETQIFAKPDAPRLLREELAKPGYVCSTIALGTATDAYQPFERKEKLTRAILQVMLETRHPVSVVTKSSLIVRDIDLWAELAGQKLSHAAISLTTLDGPLARQLEPRASAPHARLEAMGELAAAGIPATALIAPLIPGINDHELEKLLAAAKEHGASSARYTVLRLPYEVAPLFRDWLNWHAPEKAARVMSVLYDLRGQRANDPNFGSRMTGLGHYAELLRQRFALACRRLALNHDWPQLDTTRFVPPPAGDARATRQLSLF